MLHPLLATLHPLASIPCRPPSALHPPPRTSRIASHYTPFRQTLFSEGCRGSLSEELMEQFNLRAKADVQTYGLGIKEVRTGELSQFFSARFPHPPTLAQT